VKQISGPAAWPIDLIPAEEGGLIVNFPDLPNGWSQGETRGEALAQAEDLLDEMILGKMAHNEDVPRPSSRKGRPVVALPALTAAKFEAYRAMRRRTQQAPAGGAARLAAFASDPPVRRSSCLAPRPDRGGPQRSRAAPGGDERNCLSSPQGKINAECLLGPSHIAHSASRG